MKPTTKSIVEKADLAVSNLVSTGGYLNPMQANTFLRMVIDQPTIINAIRVVPMSAPTMEINKIGFGTRILQAAPASGNALAPAKRSKPTTDKVSLKTSEVIAEIHIPYDVLEDNIERGSLEDTIMAQISERSSLDLEELVILGDTGSGDAYLALMDGILMQTQSHVVDLRAGSGLVTKTVFKLGIKAMPNKYLRDRASMNFWVSPDTETEWLDSLANRPTPLGDSKIPTYGPQPAYGVPVVPAALMPNGQYVFTHPKNVILGVQRQIMIETDRDIRTRVLIVVLTLRLDIKYEEEDASVRCIGLQPNGSESTTTTS
jgi:HK97 family phage major capsid protein